MSKKFSQTVVWEGTVMVSLMIEVLGVCVYVCGGSITGRKCGGITGGKACRQQCPRNGSLVVGHPVFSPPLPFLQQLFPQNCGWRPPNEGVKCLTKEI